MNHKKAWEELKASLDRGLEGNSKYVDKATVMQVQLVMATLEEVFSDKK